MLKRQSMAVPGRHGRGDFPSLQLHSAGRSANHRLSMGGNRGSQHIEAFYRYAKGRRSSVYAAPGGTVIKQDPFVGSKGFTHKCIRNLVSFLAERQYDYAVSPKLLMRPTAKDYQSIMHFCSVSSTQTSSLVKSTSMTYPTGLTLPFQHLKDGSVSCRKSPYVACSLRLSPGLSKYLRTTILPTQAIWKHPFP